MSSCETEDEFEKLYKRLADQQKQIIRRYIIDEMHEEILDAFRDIDINTGDTVMDFKFDEIRVNASIGFSIPDDIHDEAIDRMHQMLGE